MRSLLLAALLVLAACDTSGVDVSEPITGTLVVSVAPTIEPPEILRVRTEESYSCLLPIAVDARERVEAETPVLRVEVLGIAEVDACATAIGPATAFVPFESIGGDEALLELVHLGQTDLYRIGPPGARTLTAVRASVSRAEP